LTTTFGHVTTIFDSTMTLMFKTSQ